MLTDPKLAAAFLQVLASGSFEQAAAELHLSPSAVSQRIRRLEAQTGCLLLTRRPPLRATPAGRKLVGYLRRADMLAQEMQRELAAEPQPFVLRLAVNYDILDTWLMPVLAQLKHRHRLLYRLYADDQNHTLDLLTEGEVHAALSSRSEAQRAGEVHYLGAQRYRLLAAAETAAQWFAEGMDRSSLRRAPLLVFNRKDRLQHDFLQTHFGIRADHCQQHTVPSNNAFYQALRLGFGYGMIPDCQSRDDLAAGFLCDLAPGRFADVPVYWHGWQVSPPLMQRVREDFARMAAAYLDGAAREDGQYLGESGISFAVQS